MQHSEKELKKGIKFHTIKTNKFKTNLIAIFLTTKLSRENVTKNALISSLLRRGTVNMPTQEIISKEMEEMYGASFDCGINKMGDNHVLKFYIETVNDKYLPKNNEEILKKAIDKLLEIVFNPYIEKGTFKEEYLEQEKNNIKQRIEGKIDNKSRYALNRCIEEMYKDKPYGLFNFGYIEDLNEINGKDLYEYYLQLLEKCKIDIFVSGDVDESILETVESNSNIQKLNERDAEYELPDLSEKEVEDENIVTESMDVNQGKLILGLDVDINEEDLKFDALIYNSILGGSANSKMFQNVREKAHLAYVASSSYMRQKNNIFINCGIEIKNYEKALKLIREQIEEMKDGKFSDEDIENAKKGIIAGINTIEDEQDTGITYYFGQEMSIEKLEPSDYILKINNVNKDNIMGIANKIRINTIYFLKN